MSKSIKVEIVYGVSILSELSHDEVDEIEKTGLICSPLTYVTDDEPNGYIVGQLVKKLSQSGQYGTFDFTQTQKEEVQNSLFKKLAEIGFDLADRPCQMFVNTYYY